ncbi:alpha/beta hydrolase [Corynebacterium guangdongense]|uniref:S-formylglutathione hydrolase FrmB n=1 Tax=Corynebacterium guangdongense TaxID=1783348 RepID=A0ABU1ZW45_9CORY|nr:alpha/beta hydrolase family protein [Corynebacterium guangdongense]MDR7329149.1 S-formylglutathione hydrolase FrmB [Corynebacterium guangdongense]WJZ17718.1 Diacylglycerol acyltransferase/mycolyltransferase Ag85A precursor [Corynebacterium guangdongense]
MSPTPRRLAATAAALAVLANAFPAAAQSSSPLHDAVALSSQTSASSTGSAVGSAASAVDAVGSARSSVPGAWVMPGSGKYPLPTDEGIVVPEVLAIEPDVGINVQKWSVASPAMKRVVQVQVRPAPEGAGAAPMLYLLDGVEATHPSDWIMLGHVDTKLRDDSVTLVMPTEARASMWADWYADDEVGGRHQWETFLTEELPPLLEDPAHGLDFNGKRGIGGISMGATGALAIANRNPDLFDAVFGISGCYSTTESLAAISNYLTVETRKNDFDNLYGPPGDWRWRHYDTEADPTGLADMTVYLSSARGVTQASSADHADADLINYVTGTVIEQATLVCTENLDAAMRTRGMAHQRVDYVEDGLHNWRNFHRFIEPAWEHIAPALEASP